MSLLDDICGRVRGLTGPSDGRYTALCPVHEADGNGHSPSFTYQPHSDNDDAVWVLCRAGCDAETIAAALGLGDDVDSRPAKGGQGAWLFRRRSDQEPAQPPAGSSDPPAVWRDRGGHEHRVKERYVYVDERGRGLFVVCRTTDKQFPTWNPTARRWKLGDARRVLYRLPEVLTAAKDGGTVYVCEGEKDVHAVEAAGAVATCNPGGAGKWRPEYSETLRGAHVVVVADRDEPGRSHAAKVAASLKGIAASVRTVEPVEGKDAADHLAAGHTLSELIGGGLRFHTAAQLARLTPEHITWLWFGYLARWCITELTARAKAGKTRLLLELVYMLLHGLPFLGATTERVPVVFLTEERPRTFRNALERAGLIDCEDLHILLRHEAGERDWPTVCMETVEYAQRIGAGLLIVDTLPDWSALRADTENDAGAALEALRPLQAAAAAGLGVLVCRHERKGGGEIGENARGSSAFGGAVDVLMVLRRSNTAGHETRRELEALGRFDETPSKIVIELEGDRYMVLGDASSLEREQAREAILEHLPTDPVEAVTEAHLLDACDDVKRSTAQNALKELRSDGLVGRQKGAGHASIRAYGYWRELTAKPPGGLAVEPPSLLDPSSAVDEDPSRAPQEPGGVSNSTAKGPPLRGGS